MWKLAGVLTQKNFDLGSSLTLLVFPPYSVFAVFVVLVNCLKRGHWSYRPSVTAGCNVVSLEQPNSVHYWKTGHQQLCMKKCLLKANYCRSAPTTSYISTRLASGQRVSAVNPG